MLFSQQHLDPLLTYCLLNYNHFPFPCCLFLFRLGEKPVIRSEMTAFMKMHDPTQINRQGPDYGTQYRSGIWFTSKEQQETSVDFIKELTDSELYDAKIATEIEAAKKFYPAEDVHQDYIEKTGRSCHVKNPWD